MTFKTFEESSQEKENAGFLYREDHRFDAGSGFEGAGTVRRD
jgi:hypothetical protein